VPVEEITDLKLFFFIDSWYGTRYKYGGTDRAGVDCSAFARTFMDSIYNVIIPRTSTEQYRQSKRIKKDKLHEGDLVFFYTRGRKAGITHVGVFLRNNKFVHASIGGGVMINDLSEDYYAKRYAGAGRVL
jgi:lipoprotein Spr